MSASEPWPRTIMIRMLVLRYAGLLALVVCVGVLVGLGGIAAPAVFRVLAEVRLADRRVLSGALFGEMLARFTAVSYLPGGVLLLTLILRRILGPRPHRFAWRAGIAAFMLAASAYGSIGVASRIRQLQSEIGVAPSTLPEG